MEADNIRIKEHEMQLFVLCLSWSFSTCQYTVARIEEKKNCFKVTVKKLYNPAQPITTWHSHYCKKLYYWTVRVQSKQSHAAVIWQYSDIPISLYNFIIEICVAAYIKDIPNRGTEFLIKKQINPTEYTEHTTVTLNVFLWSQVCLLGTLTPFPTLILPQKKTVVEEVFQSFT